VSALDDADEMMRAMKWGIGITFYNGMELLKHFYASATYVDDSQEEEEGQLLHIRRLEWAMRCGAPPRRLHLFATLSFVPQHGSAYEGSHSQQPLSNTWNDVMLTILSC
jgi:hypothetical protein